MTPLNEKCVLITGASTGIGAACAKRFDRLGFTVFAGVRKEADGERLRRDISPNVVPVYLDVVDPDSIRSAAEFVHEHVGGKGLTALVNNAGIAVYGPLEFMPIDRLRNQLEVNLIGQIATTQAFLPMLRIAKGRIVNMGSIAGRVSFIFSGPYASSKFALEAFTDALRMELSPWNMHVAIIEPGPIATPIWDKGMADAEADLNAMPALARDRYEKMLEKMRAAASEAQRSAIAPDVIARLVEHAVTAARPKTRYPAGPHTRLQLLLSKLPDRWRDAAVIAYLNRIKV